jgi:anthranilate/para-aminobenzoate synthase component I
VPRPLAIELRSSHPATIPTWDWKLSAWQVFIWSDGATGQTTAIRHDGEVIARWDDPLAGLAWMSRGAFELIPSAEARWIGYLSYDLGRLFETLPVSARDDLGLPLFAFVLGTASAGAKRDARPSPPCPPGKLFGSTFSRTAYEQVVARALDYIGAGDVFQVNLSQRFTADCDQTAGDVFRRLQERGGARYGACLDWGDFALVSDSPELFLKVTSDRQTGQRRVITRPVKGTRPRRPGMDGELRDSIKDQAELNMIVDLERNDLGRVCEIGSVRVIEPRAIEAHPTVYHGVAMVEGMLRPDVGFVDLLRATFPGGSITGAPKVRAMQIIEELEPVRRGPYCGAIGYLAADGSMEFNVAIRTMVLKARLAHIPVGGGIVADSQPAAEYEETLVKARAMFEALGVADEAIRAKGQREPRP